VHVRRALLLFAIVLGLAALAASLSRPRDDGNKEPAVSTTTQAPTVAPGTAGSKPPTVAFDAARDQTKKLAEDTAATVLVSVDEPGEVSIPGLGLTAAAEPVTPARFDVLAYATGRYELTFTPAAGDESEAAGTLDVTAALPE